MLKLYWGTRNIYTGDWVKNHRKEQHSYRSGTWKVLTTQGGENRKQAKLQDVFSGSLCKQVSGGH